MRLPLRWMSPAIATVVVASGALATTAVASVPRVVVAHALALPQGAHLSQLPATSSFDVALVLQHPSQLSELLTNLYRSGSTQYHHFLSPVEFAQQFGASSTSVAAVESYFAKFGLVEDSLSRGHNIVRIAGKSSAIAAAFSTSLEGVRLKSGQVATQFSSSATLPATVAIHVSAIAGLSSVVRPTTSLSSLTRSARTVATATTCPSAGSSTGSTPNSLGGYTVAQQAALYGLSTQWTKGVTGEGQTIAVYELGAFDTADAAIFFKCYGLSPSISTINVDGGATGGFNDEATMDIEELSALAPGAKIDLYSAPNNSTGPTDLYSQIADDNVASIVSTSWGDCEIDPAGATTAERQIFEQMAAQGQTVVAAAGDAGSTDCVGVTSNLPVPAVDDPASQPLVTGVGGLTISTLSPLTQSVWNSNGGASGGGQSVIWSRPSWQQGAGITSAQKGRLVPDLAVMGDPNTGFIQYFTGTSTGTVICGQSSCSSGWTSIGGTSIGAPLVSALVATSAQYCRVSRLGLLNPTLYGIAASGVALSDVTTGSNDTFVGKTNDPGVYSAKAGYDLASGLGSPTSSFVTSLCPDAASSAKSLLSVTTKSTFVGKDATLFATVRDVHGLPLRNSLLTVTALAPSGRAGIDAAASKGSGPASATVSTSSTGVARITVASLVVGPVTVSLTSGGLKIATIVVNFVRLPLALQPPAAPKVTRLVAGTRGFTLDVAARASVSAPVSSYQISVNSGQSWASFSAQSRQVTVHNLVAGHRYQVVVRAVNVNGFSTVARAGFVTPTS